MALTPSSVRPHARYDHPRLKNARQKSGCRLTSSSRRAVDSVYRCMKYSIQAVLQATMGEPGSSLSASAHKRSASRKSPVMVLSIENHWYAVAFDGSSATARCRVASAADQFQSYPKWT